MMGGMTGGGGGEGGGGGGFIGDQTVVTGGNQVSGDGFFSSINTNMPAWMGGVLGGQGMSTAGMLLTGLVAVGIIGGIFYVFRSKKRKK